MKALLISWAIAAPFIILAVVITIKDNGWPF